MAFIVYEWDADAHIWIHTGQDSRITQKAKDHKFRESYMQLNWKVAYSTHFDYSEDILISFEYVWAMRSWRKVF